LNACVSLVPGRRLLAKQACATWPIRKCLAMAAHARVVDRQAVNRIVPVTIAPWRRARLSYLAQRLVPGLRECGIAVLRPRPGPFNALSEGLEFPFVSVLVTSAPTERVGRCLE